VPVSPALAADPKPDTALKNKNVDASVLLDDKVKADPALATDCLAEGRKPFLTPEGSKIFGGARPKGDDEDQ
jgi:hypothetical protein